MSTIQEQKIDSGISTQRAVRQWKKDLKATYAPLLEMKTKLSKVLEERERSKSQKAEEKLRTKFEQEEQFRFEIQQQEKELWQEKMRAELQMVEKKIEMEKPQKPPVRSCRSSRQPLSMALQLIGSDFRTCSHHKYTTSHYPTKRNTDTFRSWWPIRWEVHWQI